MKATKKLTAVLLALVMVLTLAACGGGDGGGTKTDPAVGKYMGLEVLSYGEWLPMEEIYDLGENYIELKAGGKGTFSLDGDLMEIDWELDKDGNLTLTNYGTTCNGTLKNGLITLNDYFGFDLQLTFRKDSGSSSVSGATEMTLDDFAAVYGGDWHGMAGLTDATGDFEELNDTAHEILARLVFDGNGGCEVWLAMYLEGEMMIRVWSCAASSWAARCRRVSSPWMRPVPCMSAARWIPTWWTAPSACWRTCAIWTTRTGRTRITSPCPKVQWSTIAARHLWRSPIPLRSTPA